MFLWADDKEEAADEEDLRVRAVVNNNSQLGQEVEAAYISKGK
jgi:hypothetical protein